MRHHLNERPIYGGKLTPIEPATFNLFEGSVPTHARLTELYTTVEIYRRIIGSYEISKIVTKIKQLVL